MIVRKSVAYVTSAGRVLFFTAAELPDLGAELPGGTLLPGEHPEEGLLRELVEETGLVGFGPAHLLGIVDYDPHDGRGEVHRRHFYHVPLETPPPAPWTRVVEEGNGTFTFRFSWSLPDDPPSRVFPGHDAFLDVVARLLRGG